jgi:hypothetical protein
MSNPNIIPFQVPLPQALPTIAGNVDYRQFRDQLGRIDELLRDSGVESRLIAADLARWRQVHPKAHAACQRQHQLHAVRALRCNVAGLLLKEDFRGFAARLADSPVLQHFCFLGELGVLRVPAKSTLQRYSEWWTEAEVRALIQELLCVGATTPEQIQLTEPLDLETAFLDTTCLAANIHYPVDGVLLRDGTRTLTKAIDLIRAQGLKQRMEEPASFRARMNKLCIKMTQVSRQVDSERKRKKTFRQIDALVGTVRRHARRYRDLLDKEWAQTDWTRAQAAQVLARMDRILEQLPAARQQARERILADRQVPHAKKIISLYEADVQVIVRKKSGAEVEFGHTLLLAENPQGLIIDWQVYQDSAPADSALLAASLGRMEAAYGGKLKAVAADRGFDSEFNRSGLESAGIYNGVCPRSPAELKARGRSWKFKRLQKRRAQTEGRLGILKNAFLGQPIRRKGFAHRQLTLTWTVLAHNLWVLARRAKVPAEPAERLAA